MPADIFSATNLHAGYGKVQVLWGAGLTVGQAQTVVLLGANGAGKTTLIKTIMGLIPSWQGKIVFDGRDLTRARTDKRVRAGMSYMSEIGCFPGLSVEENIRIGGQFTSPERLRQRMAELYEVFPAMASRKKALASSLSGGQRKMVGIAKALAGDPKLLVMDEPSAGLSPLFVQEVMQVLAKFRQTGLSLLIAEQNVKFLELADHVVTLSGGRVGFSGTVEAMHADDALRRAYFGLKG
ncbi:ABC transporter ATP-binding protein [Burkholderia sp. L27(2015)]|uniref:ABC transporter ATP-binding protein n=1 Tax=Burkholderia sp. L27(2015) TaxID=1641858 RepID=UPI00131CB5F5|nr:ABC transporter ATP-binding protein [Burkholderia sp. L27(2015)]